MRSEARIIDANLNRVGEGLRVLEDIARFALNDDDLAPRCKQARHALADAASRLPLPPGLRTAARDTPGDVGVRARTESEYRREGLGAIAASAGGRAAEGLRVLEELAKHLGGDATAFESLRYEVYELARRVQAALRPIAPQWGLCVLLTASLCPGGAWERVAERAIEGGADCLQLREKALCDRELLTRARRLVEIARAAPRPVGVVINDRPDIALLSRADGVHVGQDDLTPEQARAVCGHGVLVGVSTSNLEQARRALRDGASLVGLGPMFVSTTKLRDELAGPAYLRAFLGDEYLAVMPHLCIGGITPDNAPILARAGARGLAVSAAVCAAEDPASACRALKASLETR